MGVTGVPPVPAVPPPVLAPDAPPVADPLPPLPVVEFPPLPSPDDGGLAAQPSSRTQADAATMAERDFMGTPGIRGEAGEKKMARAGCQAGHLWLGSTGRPVRGQRRCCRPSRSRRRR